MTALRFALLFSSLLFVTSADPGPASASTVERGAFFSKRQSALTLPDCGQNCYSLALSDIGTCAETDTICLCQDQSFMTQAEQCFQTACSSADITTILTLSQQICESLGTILYQVPDLAANFNISVTSATPDAATPTTLFSLPNSTSSSTTTVIPASTPTSTPSLTTTSSLATPTASKASNTTSDKPAYSNQPVKPSVFSEASLLLDSPSCTKVLFEALLIITLFFVA